MPALIFVKPVSAEPVQAVITGWLDLDTIFRTAFDESAFVDDVNAVLRTRCHNLGFDTDITPAFVIADFLGLPAELSSMSNKPVDFLSSAYRFLRLNLNPVFDHQ